MGGGEAPGRKPRTVKPQEQLGNIAGAPFMAAGFALTVLGEAELGAVMPLSEPEEKAVADALFTAVKGNPALLAAMERSGNGLSFLHLAVTLATVMQPRIAAIQEVMRYRRAQHDISQIIPQPVPQNPGGGGTVESAPPDIAAADAEPDGPAEQRKSDGDRRAQLLAESVSKTGLH